MNMQSAMSAVGSAFPVRAPGFDFSQPRSRLRRLESGRHVQPGKLLLRHLRSAGEIDAVRHLRGHIDLALHSAIDSQFDHHEKKETNWVSQWLSSGVATSWAPSVPSPCATA